MENMMDENHCVGKQAWPELLGAEAHIAKETIERENRGVKAVFIKQDYFRTHDFRCDRVWVWTTKQNSGTVVEVPRVG